MKLYGGFFKRAFDFAGAAVLILALSPLYLLCYFLIKKNMGSPAIFSQQRPGRGAKIFKIYKFRSMKNTVDADGNPLPDEERITPLGAFLRKTSLDELPQLFNVLKGDMSFIGPRPLLPQYLPYYTEREKLRHTVRPGITGLAQINGRNCTTWDKKLEFDAQYVETLSFFDDVKIALLTVKNVLCHKDVQPVSQEGYLDEIRRNAKKPDSRQ